MLRDNYTAKQKDEIQKYLETIMLNYMDVVSKTVERLPNDRCAGFVEFEEKFRTEAFAEFVRVVCVCVGIQYSHFGF